MSNQMTKVDYKTFLAERGVETTARTSLAELRRLYAAEVDVNNPHTSTPAAMKAAKAALVAELVEKGAGSPSALSRKSVTALEALLADLSCGGCDNGDHCGGCECCEKATATKRRRAVFGEPLTASVGRVRLVVTGEDGAKIVSLSNVVAQKVLRDALEGKMPKRARVGRTRVVVFADSGKALGWFDPTRLDETATALAKV